jgi:hypothetical protein
LALGFTSVSNQACKEEYHGESDAPREGGRCGCGREDLGGLISRTFGADGASVVVHYNSDATKAAADETVKVVQAAGGDAFAI